MDFACTILACGTTRMGKESPSWSPLSLPRVPPCHLTLVSHGTPTIPACLCQETTPSHSSSSRVSGLLGIFTATVRRFFAEGGESTEPTTHKARLAMP